MIKKAIYNVYLLISALAITAGGTGLAWGMYYGSNRLPLRQYFQRDHVNAVWDWSNVLTKSDKDIKDVSDFMYLHQLNAVYLDVGQFKKFVSKNPQPLSASQIQEKMKFESAIEHYVTELGKRSIRVYAAAGNTDWSQPEQQYIPIGILNFVHQYNEKHPSARLAGMQFDIESYNQKGFSQGSTTTKSLVLTDFLEMVDTLTSMKETYIRTNNDDFELGFAIPYWFDNQNGNIPSVAWHHKTGPTLYHLLDRLNKSPGNNVVVMAYRNAARGNDGVISLSRTEAEYAQTVAPNVRVIIGQEVTDVEPAKITYFGKSATELSSEVKFIDEAFQDIPQFRGIAINDLAGFMELESNK